MVEFGWSVDTVIALITVSWKVYEAFKGAHNASAQYKALVADYAVFHRELEHMQHLLQQHEVPIIVGCETFSRTIDGCRKFQQDHLILRIDPKTWKETFNKGLATARFPFSKDIARLREEIKTSLSVVSMYSNRAILQTLLEERDRSVKTRAELEEIYRRVVPFPRNFNAHELHSSPFRGSELASQPVANALALSTSGESSIHAPTRPLLHELSSAPSVGRTTVDAPPQPYERLQYVYNELSVFDRVLHMQELQSDTRLQPISELSEVNYDAESNVFELDGESSFSGANDQFQIGTAHAAADRIRRTRSEIRSILARVQNAEKRMRSMDSVDSGYGTGRLESLGPLADFVLGPGRISGPEGLEAPLVESPSPSSPQPNSFSPEGGFGITGTLHSASPPSSDFQSSSSRSSSHVTAQPISLGCLPPPALNPMLDSTPGISSSIESVKSRTNSLSLNKPGGTSVETYELLASVIFRAVTDSVPSTKTLTNSLKMRRYPHDVCSQCESCPTLLKWRRRPQSQGLSLIITCLQSGVEVEHQLSSRYEVIPQIKHPKQGNDPFSVYFKVEMSSRIITPTKVDGSKFKAVYTFSGWNDWVAFQNFVLGKKILDILYLEAVKSSLVPKSGSRSETLRVLSDGATISVLIYGALIDPDRLEHHEAIRSEFRTLVENDVSPKDLRVRLHLTTATRSPDPARRHSSVSSVTSNSSASGRTRAIKWIELVFEKPDALRTFIMLWEPDFKFV